MVLQADGMALTVARGQARLGVTERGPTPADAGRAGVRLPASPLRPGPPQRPALGRSRAAFTRLQLPHPLLQVLVLEQRVGGVGGAGSASPTDLWVVETEAA